MSEEHELQREEKQQPRDSSIELVPNSGREKIKTLIGGNDKKLELSMIHKMKKDMLRAYREQNPGIIENLPRSNTGYNTDELYRNIVDDLLASSESLMGNALIMEAQGELRDSSAITIKRADMLKIIADVITKQKELQQKAGEIDYNSPVFRMFQKLCFDRLIEALEALNIDLEMRSLIVNEWERRMREWDKDIKKAMKELEQEG